MAFQKFIITLIWLLFTNVVTEAQIQSGYIRTVGRPDNIDGDRIPGVRIRVSGLHTDYMSDDNGNFRLNLGGGKDSYVLTEISKMGYELQEKEIIGRKFPVSATIPHEIVMVSLKNKEEIEVKIRKMIEANYQSKIVALNSKIAELEEELKKRPPQNYSEELKCIQKEYQLQLRQLQKMYENSTAMVNEKVELYSHMDYSKLSDLEIQIYNFIENGEFERADSLINSLNLPGLEAELEQINIDIAKKKKRKRDIEDSLSVAYNGKFEVLSMKFEPDSAVYYIEKLVALNPVNVKNLLMASNYITENVSDFDRALEYAESALNICRDNGNTYYQGCCYNSLGLINTKMGLWEVAYEHYKAALDIFLEHSCYSEMLTLYVNIADTYIMNRQYLEALRCFTEAQNILIKHKEELNYEIAFLYNNVGILCAKLGQYEDALKFHEVALNYWMKKYGERSSFVAYCYMNMGQVYTDSFQFAKSLDFNDKALEIFKEIYGETNYNVAACYHNRGLAYLGMRELEKALDCQKESLDIWLTIFGEDVSYAAMGYHSIGVVYKEMEEYEKSLGYLNKALKIKLEVLKNHGIDLAIAYESIGNVYYRMKLYDKSLEYYDMALEEFAEPICVDWITIFCNLGGVLLVRKDYESAKEFYGIAEDLCQKVYIKYPLSVAVVYSGLGLTYLATKEFSDALHYLENARNLYSKYDNQEKEIARLNEIIRDVQLSLDIVNHK